MVRDGLDRSAHHRRCGRTAPGRSSAATTATSTSWTPTPGERILPDVETGDIIKGTPTIDPEGFPLVYSGSRDDLLRVIAFDRPGQAEVLWTLDSESVAPNLWNDDWDSSPIILGDYMIVGSESSRFWVIKLNRSYDAAGQVQVDPEVVFTDAGVGSRRCSAANGDEHASVESSVAVYENTAYFGTSAGLIWGYDISGLDEGKQPDAVFRFYTAGDNDPTPIVDDEGMLYVAGQNDRPGRPSRRGRASSRSSTRRNEANPIVWTFNETDGQGAGHLRHPGDRGRHHRRHQRRRPAHRARPRHRRGEVGAPARRSGVGQPRDRRRRAAHRRLPRRRLPRLRHVRPRRGARPSSGRCNLGGCIEATPAVWNGQDLHRLPRPRATSTSSGVVVVDVASRRCPAARPLALRLVAVVVLVVVVSW